MARYRGPRIKVCRSLGIILPGLTTKSTLVRPYPPGMHGARRRTRRSDYKDRLSEKQKLRFHFGVLEKQFKRYVAEAARQKGPTGANLLSLLESRLDNIVWRLGLARTIPAARQLVVHGHIYVNGTRVDRPSFRVKPGHEISVRPKSRKLAIVNDSVSNPSLRLAGYLSFDNKTLTGRMEALPTREDIPFDVDEQLVVEYYSPRL